MDIDALRLRFVNADDTLSVVNYKDVARILCRRPASVGLHSLTDGKKGPYSYQDIVDVRDKLYAEDGNNNIRSVVLTLNDLHKGHKMVYTDRLRRLRDELRITSQEMIDRATGHGIGAFPTDITAADLDH